MYLLPELKKMQKENDELKVTLKNKDPIVQTTRGNLMRLNTKNIELGLVVNTTQQKLDYEIGVCRSLQAKKESVD